jgi:hypothetical protein
LSRNPTFLLDSDDQKLKISTQHTFCSFFLLFVIFCIFQQYQFDSITYNDFFICLSLSALSLHSEKSINGFEWLLIQKAL